eukprot:CAMPEP_0197923718 /NCGR_PEP_ID=MMETSP1439-20131203/94484_1 /TAXON_ID=66791 /ORGANISM="Gonyaulax spinifera, Strain CCMP409" /LENGTH=152 /DNA_ID=CAMNT_0043546107 /DNA_START=21 /DNA_END=475 /DNA_ORIENTATION=-
MEAISSEVLQARDAVARARPDLDLGGIKSVHEWFLASYPGQIRDASTLRSCLLSNSAYIGLTHPMQEADGGKLLPDFKHRYFTEDLPMGLIPLRSIAQLAGVETPTLDRVILWMQERIGKEYIKDGQLSGRDVSEARAAERFGITSIEQLVG